MPPPSSPVALQTARLNLARPAEPTAHMQGLQLNNAVYSCEYSADPNFPDRDTYELTGTLNANGGHIKLHNDNGTFADTTITFSAPWVPSGSTEQLRNMSMTIAPSGTGKHTHYTGISIAIKGESGGPIVLEWMNPTTKAVVAEWRQGPNPPPPPPEGSCRLYTTVKSTAPAPSTYISGGPAIEPGPTTPTLYPSWPASSQWVTAVG